MIDLHFHILPGIDDGPGTLEEAKMLAARAADDGTELVAATPHFREDHPAVRPDELAGRTASVNNAISDIGLGLEVVPAAEVDLTIAMEVSADQLRLASYGQRGTDVLVETPYGPLTSSFEQFLFNRFTSQSLRVLLAHPERNPSFQDDPDRLAALVHSGILLQVTASSLASDNSRSRSRKAARALVKEGLAHVIASDAHGPEIARAPLSAGVAEANRLVPGRGDWMVNDAPAAILAGDPLPEPPATKQRRGRMFRLPSRRG